MSAKSNRHNLFIILIAMLLLFLLLGCAPCCWFVPPSDFLDNLNWTTGSVKGSCYIVSNEGKQSVGKLSVTIGDKTVTSDADGTFLVTGLEPGTYDVRVAGGDLGYTGKVTVRAGETTDLGELQLYGTLPPPTQSAPDDSTTDT